MKLTLKPRNRVLACNLETPRFQLRSLGVIDAVRLTLDWRNDPEMLKAFTPWGLSVSRFTWLRHGPLPDNVYRFAHAIVPKTTGEPIGLHMVRLNPGRVASCQIAIRDRAWWGRDVSVEVRARVINHFFRHAPIDAFRTRAAVPNAASIFVYKRLGFAYVETLKHERIDPLTGEPVDYVVFEMTRDRWARGPFSQPAEAAPLAALADQAAL